MLSVKDQIATVKNYIYLISGKNSNYDHLFFDFGERVWYKFRDFKIIKWNLKL